MNSNGDHVRTLQFKTRLCNKIDSRGKCHCLKACPFAHDISELRLPPDLSKTKMCPKLNYCDYHKCRFAHSMEELRPIPISQSDSTGVLNVDLSRISLVLTVFSPYNMSIHHSVERDLNAKLQDGIALLRRGASASSCLQGILTGWARVAVSCWENSRISPVKIDSAVFVAMACDAYMNFETQTVNARQFKVNNSSIYNVVNPKMESGIGGTNTNSNNLNFADSSPINENQSLCSPNDGGININQSVNDTPSLFVPPSIFDFKDTQNLLTHSTKSNDLNNLLSHKAGNSLTMQIPPININSSHAPPNFSNVIVQTNFDPFLTFEDTYIPNQLKVDESSFSSAFKQNSNNNARRSQNLPPPTSHRSHSISNLSSMDNCACSNQLTVDATSTHVQENETAALEDLDEGKSPPPFEFDDLSFAPFPSCVASHENDTKQISSQQALPTTNTHQCLVVCHDAIDNVGAVAALYFPRVLSELSANLSHTTAAVKTDDNLTDDFCGDIAAATTMNNKVDSAVVSETLINDQNSVDVTCLRFKRSCLLPRLLLHALSRERENTFHPVRNALITPLIHTCNSMQNRLFPRLLHVDPLELSPSFAAVPNDTSSSSANSSNENVLNSYPSLFTAPLASPATLSINYMETQLRSIALECSAGILTIDSSGLISCILADNVHFIMGSQLGDGRSHFSFSSDDCGVASSHPPQGVFNFPQNLNISPGNNHRHSNVVTHVQTDYLIHNSLAKTPLGESWIAPSSRHRSSQQLCVPKQIAEFLPLPVPLFIRVSSSLFGNSSRLEEHDHAAAGLTVASDIMQAVANTLKLYSLPDQVSSHVTCHKYVSACYLRRLLSKELHGLTSDSKQGGLRIPVITPLLRNSSINRACALHSSNSPSPAAQVNCSVQVQHSANHHLHAVSSHAPTPGSNRQSPTAQHALPLNMKGVYLPQPATNLSTQHDFAAPQTTTSTSPSNHNASALPMMQLRSSFAGRHSSSYVAPPPFPPTHYFPVSPAVTPSLASLPPFSSSVEFDGASSGIMRSCHSDAYQLYTTPSPPMLNALPIQLNLPSSANLMRDAKNTSNISVSIPAPKNNHHHSQNQLQASPPFALVHGSNNSYVCSHKSTLLESLSLPHTPNLKDFPTNTGIIHTFVNKQQQQQQQNHILALNHLGPTSGGVFHNLPSNSVPAAPPFVDYNYFE